jgi:hypothetical protein
MSPKRWFATLGLVTLLLAACRAGADDKPAKVSIRGQVSNVRPADPKAAGVLGVLLVEGAKEKDTEHDKASVRVTKDTKIEKKTDKGLKPAKFEDIKKGSKVEVTFTGPVAESYPVQARAGRIVILGAAK